MPAPKADTQVIQQKLEEATRQPLPTKAELSAEAYINRSDAHFRSSDYDGAIADCTEAIRLNPHFAEAYNRRGAAYYSKGDYPLAFADFKQVLRLNPKLYRKSAVKPLPYAV